LPILHIRSALFHPLPTIGRVVRLVSFKKLIPFRVGRDRWKPLMSGSKI
jgi:hypothetical protein